MDTSKLKEKTIEIDGKQNVFIDKDELKPVAKTKQEKRHKKTFKKPFYVVTERQFKTKKKTYKISKIEKTEIRRNFIVFFPISILSLLFTYKFWNYLYTNEVIFIISLSLIVGFASLLLGTLYIYSKALGEPAIFNFIPVLRKIRNEIDEAMFTLEEKEALKKDVDIDD